MLADRQPVPTIATPLERHPLRHVSRTSFHLSWDQSQIKECQPLSENTDTMKTARLGILRTRGFSVSWEFGGKL